MPVLYVDTLKGEWRGREGGEGGREREGGRSGKGEYFTLTILIPGAIPI